MVAELVPPTPFRKAASTVVWAGERVLYDGEVNGRPSIVAAALDDGSPVELVSNASWVAATTSGDTVVFMREDTDRYGSIWKVGASAAG